MSKNVGVVVAKAGGTTMDIMHDVFSKIPFGDLVNNIIDHMKKDYSKAGIELAVKKAGEQTAAMAKKQDPGLTVAALEQVKDRAGEIMRKRIDSIISGKISPSAVMGRKYGRTIAKFSIKWVIPILIAATILYLFSEIVDSFNIKKLKEEDNREEFERIV